MKLSGLKGKIDERLYGIIANDIKELRPAQSKSIDAGLFDRKNLLVCTPTASGKTLVAELGAVNSILKLGTKAVYIVPLKALASEKYREFKKKYSHLMKIALSIGDMDSSDSYLSRYDLIVCTAEKFDSLIRHHTPWLSSVGTVVIDEIHMLNDPGRGPTLEVLITILRTVLKDLQIIGLSATIGNPEALAGWLDANLIEDEWRPVRLEKGIYFNEKIEFG